MSCSNYYSFVVVGVGGTGGNFAKEFCRFVAFLPEQDRKHIAIAFVDGDTIEGKNCSRQPYLSGDETQNKAEVLAEAIGDNFGFDVLAYPKYIDRSIDFKEIFECLNKKLCTDNDMNYLNNVMQIILGCVDNHRARQVMEEYYKNQWNCLYIDSANEFSVGEVVFGCKKSSKELSPCRSHYYPDILLDKSPSKSEESCGAVNVSAPQHLVTNLMASQIIFTSCVKLISENVLPEGIVYFDAFKYFIAHRSYVKTKEKISEVSA